MTLATNSATKCRLLLFAVFVARYFLNASPVRNSTSPLFFQPFLFFSRENEIHQRVTERAPKIPSRRNMKPEVTSGKGRARHLARPTKYNNIARVHIHIHTCKRYVLARARMYARTDKPLLDNLVDRTCDLRNVSLILFDNLLTIFFKLV